jgi:hypothetical protein
MVALVRIQFSKLVETLTDRRNSILSVKKPQTEKSIFLLDRWLINIEICKRNRINSSKSSLFVMRVFRNNFFISEYKLQLRLETCVLIGLADYIH